MSTTKHSPIRVEIHCWKDGVPQFPVSPYDVTRFVVGCSWTNSIHPPWTDIQVQMAIPFRYIRNVLPGRPVKYSAWTPSNNEVSDEAEFAGGIGYVPEPGFWLVVYQTPAQGVEQAVAVGRVHDIHFGMATSSGSGSVVTTPVTLKAESILSFLGKSMLQLSGAANTAQETDKEGAAQPAGTNTQSRTGVWGREGFVYDLQSWNNALSTLLQTPLSTLMLGEFLTRLWESIVKITLPPSLGGGEIGDLVPIVYNESTADTYAPMRGGQVPFVPGATVTPRASDVLPRGQSILQFFFSLFGADPLCTEFFCSLEYKAKTTALGTALKGAQPVIVYRLRPWFIAPPSKDANQAYTESAYKGEVGAISHLAMVGWTKNSAGQLGPRTGEDWYWWNREDIENVAFSFSDSMRVNMAYGAARANGGSEAMTYGITSMPIVPSNSAVDRHGLRPYVMNWPFTGRDQYASLTPTQQEGAAVAPIGVLDYNNAVAELAWIYGGDGQRWATGSISGRFRPWVMQGQWIVARMADSVLTGYIESVTHTVQVNQSTGLHGCRTDVSFSRGTLRHQDSPEWQYRPETAYLNAPGAPASLLDGASSGADEGYTALQVQKKQEAALVAAKAAAKVAGVTQKTTVLYSPSGPLLPGTKQKPLGRTVEFIVIHYTNGATTKDMLRMFNQKKDGYHTGTHYSVDPQGVIVEWADPSFYVTNNAPGFNENGIGIDVVGTPAQIRNMSALQRKALAALIGDLRKRFPKIQGKVATQRAPVYVKKTGDYKAASGDTPSPYTASLARQEGWGILRHRDVTHTSCPGEVNVEEAVLLSLPLGWTIERTPLTTAQEAAIK